MSCKLQHPPFSLPLLKKHLTFLPCPSVLLILSIVSLHIKWISRFLLWLIPDPTACFLLSSSDILSLHDTFAFDCLLLLLLEFAEQVIWAGYSVRFLGHLLPRLPYISTEHTASMSFSLHANFETVVIPLLLVGICLIKVLRPHLEDGHFSWLKVCKPFSRHPPPTSLTAAPRPCSFTCLRHWEWSRDNLFLSHVISS